MGCTASSVGVDDRLYAAPTGLGPGFSSTWITAKDGKPYVLYIIDYLLTGLEGLEVIFAILVIFCRNLGQSKHPDLLMRGEICNPGWIIIPL